MKKVLFLLVLVSIVAFIFNSFNKIPQPDIKLQNEICYEEQI